MFKRILFPTDFSPFAQSAFWNLLHHLPSQVESVHLAYIIPEIPTYSTASRIHEFELLEWQGIEEMRLLRSILGSKNIAVKDTIGHGVPASEITKLAKQHSIDLIFLGTHHGGHGYSATIGSTAIEIIRQSPCPVLVQNIIHPRDSGKQQQSEHWEHLFRRLLFPTDFSPCASKAFEIIQKMRPLGLQEVVIIHIQDSRLMRHRSPEQILEFDQEDSSRLNHLCGILAAHKIKARYQLHKGIPHKEVIRTVDSEQPCVIVIGAQGRSALEDLFLGSTFENVVRNTTQPVLVIKN